MWDAVWVALDWQIGLGLTYWSRIGRVAEIICAGVAFRWTWIV